MLPTETDLAMATGVREGFVQGRPSDTNAKANLEQTSNESEVAGFSGEEQGATPARCCPRIHGGGGCGGAGWATADK